jgi:CheY-like chemotaxis protein
VTQVTVLLVDDAEDCVTTLDLALKQLPGVILRWARTAEEALHVLAQDSVKAIVTDIHLPKMNGLELIEKVRHDPGRQSLPIVVVSADPDPATPRNAIELGANAFFSKPFSPGAVRKKLEELIYGVPLPSDSRGME